MNYTDDSMLVFFILCAFIGISMLFILIIAGKIAEISESVRIMSASVSALTSVVSRCEQHSK